MKRLVWYGFVTGQLSGTPSGRVDVPGRWARDACDRESKKTKERRRSNIDPPTPLVILQLRAIPAQLYIVDANRP
jgi:hypothetical protein